MNKFIRHRQAWETEPDHWTEYIGEIHLIAVRHVSSRSWCGYIGLPAKDWRRINIDKVPVHYEVTYFGPKDEAGGRSDYKYLGFDCDHVKTSDSPDGFGDFSPRDFYEGNNHRLKTGVYRTLPYVQNVCRAAAANVARQRSWWSRALRWLAGWFIE